jgi:transcriptional regulator with XRE-family HTH domain
MIHDSLKRRDVADAKAIGLRIRAARKSRSWKIRDLAEAVGMARQTVACWECGARVPHTWSMMIRLCHALRRSSDWLLYGVAKRGALWRMVPPERTGGGSRSETGSAAVPSAEA